VQAKSRARARRIILAVALGIPLAFAVAPIAGAYGALVMEPFPGGSRTNDPTPTFAGMTEDANPGDEVVVSVYAGESASGEAVRKPRGSPFAGIWSATVLTPLEDGTYTAVAEQTERFGGLGLNETSVSAPYTFTVDTHPPKVTLDQPLSPSHDATPSFSGTASDTTLVTIALYSGASAEGTPVATLKVQGNGGGWSSSSLAVPLADGTYTAVATQPSSLAGNGTGMSNDVTFVIDTRSPKVTLEPLLARSNDRMPSFAGTASEDEPVTVEVFEGTRAEGAIIRTVTAEGTRAGWTSARLTPPLPVGRHTFTAVATQPSAIGNPTGRSEPVTFVVDTEPPTVRVNPPPPRSNDPTPSFSGSATEATPVAVEIFAGERPEGAAVASASATVTGGSWTSTPVLPALADGTYTALAIEQSAIENGPGHSAPVVFTIDTKPPTVTLTPLPTPSGNAAPSFSGTATEMAPVTVSVYRGASARGTAIVTATAEVVSGTWITQPLSPELEWGEYTAVATQPSSIGNAAGVSAPVTFVLEPIAPVVATESATGVTATTAALYAWVNPRGAPVSACFFEYGVTTVYGKRVGCGFTSGVSGFPPLDTAPVPVFARIYGLTPSTVYHFRISAAGGGGTAQGADATFTTLTSVLADEEGSPSSRAPAGISAAALAGMIAGQLAPHGRAARIAAIVRRGGFIARLKSPEAGEAVVNWYYTPPGARTAAASSRKAVRVAFGSVMFRAAATRTLKLYLTPEGASLLRRLRRARLVAKCLFTPRGARAVKSSATFELRR
jgi:Bacterial Ig-like domain